MTDIVNGLLLRDRHVLLALRSATRRNYPNVWSFPGGHVEPGETLEQALTRELSEEIGVRPATMAFLQSLEDRPASSDRITTFHLFAVDDWQGEPAILNDEHAELRWVNLAAAAKMQGLALPAYVDVFESLVAA
ncbi:MAG: NUDIX domain-containing protein [Pseudomonadota bacterium]